MEAYTTLDLRLAWQVDKHLEFSLVGQNLLEDSHLEYETDGVDWMTARVPRSGYIQMRSGW